jgi:hypothetical protein
MHAAAAAAGARATASPPDPYPGWRAAAAEVLIARGGADSLAAGAALRFAAQLARTKGDAPSPHTAAEVAAQACDLEPENPNLSWLRLQLCIGTPGCDVREAATTMRWVAAENAAAWMPTLAAAQKDRDIVEIDRILVDMAQGARFDLYVNRTVVLLFDALKRVAGTLPAKYLPSDVARLDEATGITNAEIIPSFSPLQGACREAAETERRGPCLKIAKLMQHSDTVSAQLAGFNIERHLAPPDSREARAVVERRRALEWRVSSAAQFDTPLIPWLKSARARARIAEMRALPREEDVALAILRQHRKPLEPPEEYP